MTGELSTQSNPHRPLSIQGGRLATLPVRMQIIPIWGDSPPFWRLAWIRSIIQGPSSAQVPSSPRSRSPQLGSSHLPLLPNQRGALRLVGQIAAPLQVVWVAAHLARWLHGATTPPIVALDRFKELPSIPGTTTGCYRKCTFLGSLPSPMMMAPPHTSLHVHQSGPRSCLRLTKSPVTGDSPTGSFTQTVCCAFFKRQAIPQPTNTFVVTIVSSDKVSIISVRPGTFLFKIVRSRGHHDNTPVVTLFHQPAHRSGLTHGFGGLSQLT